LQSFDFRIYNYNADVVAGRSGLNLEKNIPKSAVLLVTL
jgi:hypothetical protein